MKRYITLTEENIQSLINGEEVPIGVCDSQGGYRLVYLVSEDAYEEGIEDVR